MNKARAKKITATEMLEKARQCLAPENKRGGFKAAATAKRVLYRSDTYYLQFVEGYRMMMLTPSLVRTLAKTFGDDCDDWKGAGVTLVHYHEKLLVRKDQ